MSNSFSLTWLIIWSLFLVYWSWQLYKHRKGFTQDDFKNSWKWLRDAPEQPKCSIYNWLLLFGFFATLLCFSDQLFKLMGLI